MLSRDCPYTLLTAEQLVGICLFVFVRPNLIPFIRYATRTTQGDIDSYFPPPISSLLSLPAPLFLFFFLLLSSCSSSFCSSSCSSSCQRRPYQHSEDRHVRECWQQRGCGHSLPAACNLPVLCVLSPGCTPEQGRGEEPGLP